MIQVQTSSPDLVAALSAQTKAIVWQTAAIEANTAALKASQPPGLREFRDARCAG